MILLFNGIIACNSAQSGKDSQEKVTTGNRLNGTWELNYVSGAAVPFEKLFERKKPSITFDTANGTFSGNNGCNNFNGKLISDGSKIDFNQPIATTRKACIDAQAETVFMEALKKVNGYSVSEDGQTLNFLTGDIGTMRFTKK